MFGLLNLLNIALPMLYGLAAVNYQVCFMRRDPFAERTVTPFLLSTFILHTFFFVLRMVAFGRQPFANLAEAVSLMGLAMAGVYLYVERVQRNQATGAFILPFVVVLQLVASAMMPATAAPVSELLRHPLFGLHAAMAALGYAAFFTGAMYGLMYLLLHRALKRKKFGLVFERLPSLNVLASMSFWAVFLGWLALAVAILFGIVMSIATVPEFYRDYKTITTVMVWLVYAVSVVAYFLLGWRGERTVYLSLFGFFFALAAIITSNFIWAGFHSFLT